MSVEKHYLSFLSVPNSNTKMKIIRREIKLNNLTLSPRSPRQCIPCSCQWTRRGHHGHVEFALSEWWRGHTLLWSCSTTQPQPGGLRKCLRYYLDRTSDFSQMYLSTSLLTWSISQTIQLTPSLHLSIRMPGPSSTHRQKSFSITTPKNTP